MANSDIFKKSKNLTHFCSNLKNQHPIQKILQGYLNSTALKTIIYKLYNDFCHKIYS